MKPYVTTRKHPNYWCSGFDNFPMEDKLMLEGTVLTIDLDRMMLSACGGIAYVILDEHTSKYPPGTLIICEHVIYAPSNALWEAEGEVSFPLNKAQKAIAAALQYQEEGLKRFKTELGKETRVRYIDVSPKAVPQYFKLEMADRPD